MNKNTLTRILSWFAVTLLFANFLPFSAQDTSAEQSDAPAFIQLEVDTQLDYGDPAHQVCTALPNDCSLRGAISKANTDTGQSYQVSLPAGTYMLSIQGTGEDANATGDLDVRARLLLAGAGAGNTSIDAQAIDRVFQIQPRASLTLQDITITGGHTMDGAEGIPGGDSENGGGIYNTGLLELTDSIVSSNSTGVGGLGVDGSAGNGYQAGHGGGSGKGGGIYNTGWLILNHTDLLSNRTGNGGNGGSNPTEPDGSYCGFGGSSGDGGGFTRLVYCGSRKAGFLTISEAVVESVEYGGGNRRTARMVIGLPAVESIIPVTCKTKVACSIITLLAMVATLVGREGVFTARIGSRSTIARSMTIGLMAVLREQMVEASTVRVGWRLTTVKSMAM